METRWPARTNMGVLTVSTVCAGRPSQPLISQWQFRWLTAPGPWGSFPNRGALGRLGLLSSLNSTFVHTLQPERRGPPQGTHKREPTEP